MNFSTPSKVIDTIRASDQVEQVRGENRVKVNQLLNGSPPLTSEQAKKLNVKINVNWCEGAILAAHARRQYETALLGSENFFKVSLPKAPPEKRQSWEIAITQSINRIMKRSECYASEKESQFAAVVAHGIGPIVWFDRESWEPECVAVEDFRVATDTKTSFKNLSWLAVRVLYTEGDLSRKVFGKYSMSGWNKDAIKKILQQYHNVNYEQTNYDWINAPEKMAELVKQNAGFYSGDGVPTIPLWHFYYMDDANPSKQAIKLCVVPDLGVRGAVNDEFLYESERPIARKWTELMNVQFGDLNNKAPFLFHSVRSLGFLLMEPCFWTNLFRCRLLQHGFENFNVWLRSSDPEGRARAQKFELFDRGWVPEGVSIVPQNERHQINEGLVGSIMGQLRQLQQEASQTYTQQLDQAGQRPQTAYETGVKVASVNAMMSGLLKRAFRKEGFFYKEIARRFCLRNSCDPDVLEFQDDCKEAGVPKLWINCELWAIEPEIPMGAGNPTMAQSEAMQLMAVREKLDPTAQQEILHDYVEVFTNDPKRAERLVPLAGQRGVTDAQRDAEFAFGTLMQGVPVRLRPTSPIEQIETLLGLMAGVIAQLERNGGMADAREIVGLQSVATHIGGLIQQLAPDKAQKERVKNYADALGNLTNMIKAYAQRLQQQKAAGNGGQMDPALIGKLQSETIKAQSKAKISEATAAQRMAHKEKGFEAEQQRRNFETAAEIGREVEIDQTRKDLGGEPQTPQ